MNNELQNIDDLLAKYLSGEATETEMTVVNQWVSSNQENRRYFEQMEKIFHGASSIRYSKEYDTDAAWIRLRQNLQKKSAPVVPLHSERKMSAMWWKVAAAILVVAIAGIFVMISLDNEPRQVEVAAEKHAVKDTLPDGTDVFLNKKTVVKYAYDNKTKTHDVRLNGEAYFNIKHSKREQFVIDAGDVFIKDIGTSFNVKAYPDSDLVEVLVEEGEVIFFTADNPGIRLKESGKAVYNKKTKQFTIDEPDPNITAYKTKFFVFSNTNLGAAAHALNDVYDTTIVVPDHLKNCPITVSFRNESVDEIATILAETMGLTVNEENGKLILNGKACD